jgi:hypothetical protein|tara:strand:+ start:1139 stop:1531 length:393 start_codon:yes stop_codon:yes gene_type:complete
MKKRGKTIFLEDESSLGAMLAPPELLKFMDKTAAKLNMSRSAMNRRVMEAFCLYMEEAKVFGKTTFFNKKQTVGTWLEERNDFHKMTAQVEKLLEEIKTAKTPDEKLALLSTQVAIMGHMINLLHKSTMT